MKVLKGRVQLGGILLLMVLCGSCMKQAATEPDLATDVATDITARAKGAQALPVQYQQAAYILDQQPAMEKDIEEESVLKVGANISTDNGPMPLWVIVKELVASKGMNVSWASDVDKNKKVDVSIRADDDLYLALDNMLRQVDYFHEVQGKTVIIKYKETRQFQIAMPFAKQKFSTTVGGNLLGSSGKDNGSNDKQIDGVLGLDSKDNEFDLWRNIKLNLDTILEVWSWRRENEMVDANKERIKSENAATEGARSFKGTTEQKQEIGQTADSSDNSTRESQAQETSKKEKGQGYYIIDKPVGLITVTAPRPTLEKVERYINNLKKKLYKQISIEAKIIEVQLDNESNVGINWNNVFKNFKLLSGALTFGANGQVYPRLKNNPLLGDKIYTDHIGQRTYGLDEETNLERYHSIRSGVAFYDAIHPGQFISKIALGAANFTAFVNALKEEGQTKILSNPKISVMNGQPAMITVGQNRTYVDSVEVDIDTDSNTKTYSTTTSRLLSGVGMALTATILDNKEIIMNLVPITSELVDNDIPYEYIGSEGVKVGVPIINVREMSTTVRVGDGEMLVIGGLISDAESKDENFMPVLGDIPGIRYLFGYEQKKHKKRELIILLRPKII